MEIGPSDDFYRDLVEHIVDAIIVVDDNRQVYFANPAAAGLFARPISQIMGVPFGYPISGNGPQEVEIVRPDGLPCIAEMRVEKAPFRGKTYHVVSLRDITELALQREELNTLSLMDGLTGLYNRRGFFTLANLQRKTAYRNEQCFALFYIDLDGLKQINDTYGHTIGDQALQETAALLRKTFRETDIKARLGGDEFCVLAIDANKDISEKLTTRLEKGLLAFNQLKKQPVDLSLSLGVSHFIPQQPATLERLLEQADAVMYSQKALKKRNTQ